MIDLRDIIHDGVNANRAADTLRVVSSDRGGLTTWHKRKVAGIAAPMCGGAQARTIRIHELLHANHSPATNRGKYPAIARNAIEDARVHSAYWPGSMPKQAARDCLATALTDMRTIPTMAALGRAEDWNLSLLVALRAMSILAKLDHRRRHWARLIVRATQAFGPIVAEKLNDILSLSKKHKTQALREFTALMRSDDEADAVGENWPGGKQQGKGSAGKNSSECMRIVRLPMPEVCDSSIRRTSLARSGARLNRSRLARAVSTGSTTGLFIRPRYLPGGSYLLDASGSMGLTAERLNELCRTVPAATVAYYSGWGSAAADGAYGELAIYAENGRRAADVDRMHGGNNVDLYAIQWLLRQPGPRVYIGDGGFCGGPEGQDVQAATLLASAVAHGKIVWKLAVSELD